MGKFVDGFNGLSGTGGSDAGKGQSFQTLVTEQNGNAGTSCKTWNQPHLTLDGHILDFCAEVYTVDEKVGEPPHYRKHDIPAIASVKYDDVRGQTVAFYATVPMGSKILSAYRGKTLHVTKQAGDVVIIEDLAKLSEEEVKALGKKLPDGWDTKVMFE